MEKKRSLIQVDHVHKYVNSKIGRAWPISSLFLDPLPILAIRNQNDCNTADSPFFWGNNANLTYAIHVAIPLLARWKALRTNRKGGQQTLKDGLNAKAPSILLRFQNQARDLGTRRLSDVKPNQSYYGNFLVAAANAASIISELKKVETPMIGSKFMHFFIPELFPVWDTAVIENECLKNEELPPLPETVKNELQTKAGKSYAQYVHFLVTEHSQASSAQRTEVLNACIQQCADEYDADVNEMGNVLYFHCDDLWPTVLEICLIGKHR